MIDVVLLAGGLGSRMGGSDKGLLKLHKKQFVELILGAFEPLECRPVIVANRHLSEYRQLVSTYKGIVVQDSVANSHGPLGGLLAARSHLRSEWVFVVPCDTPCLDSRFPERMLAAGRKRACAAAHEENRRDGFAADDGKRTQVMHLLVRSTAFGRLPELEPDGGKAPGLMRWISALNLQPVDFSDCPELFENINTPEQLQILKAAGRQSPDCT